MKLEKRYYPNGQLASEGYEVNGNRVGLWTWYDEDGNVQTRTEYSEDSVWEKDTEFYSNGQIKHEYDNVQKKDTRFYSNGQIQYERDARGMVNYWDEDGTQLVTDGNGRIVHYHQNGAIYSIAQWQRYQLNGELQRYYDNGQLMYSANYVNGLEDGRIMSWYMNGQLKSDFFVKRLRIVDTYTNWYESGQLQEEGFARNGIGVPKNYWDENGNQLLIEGTGYVLREYYDEEGDFQNYYEEHFVNYEREGDLIYRT